MKTLNKPKKDIEYAPMIKIGASRQVAIPKKIYDALDLSAGDYLEIKVEKEQLILTPQMFIEKRLAEGLRDIRQGRTIGPFKTAHDAIKALRS